MNSFPLVSVIIPTRNSEQFLEACLQSIKNQSYKNIEIIVVDNNSTDNTKEIVRSVIARSEATWQSRIFIFNKGPERSTQRNYGAKNANGKYFLFIDSDMELTPKVVGDCVKKIQSDEKIKALVIPEKSVGIGFWADCKALERSFYVGVDWIEAARFYKRNFFNKIGGYDESMISGEDWDITQKIEKLGKIERISEYILHNEGTLYLRELIIKKFYYAQKISNYLQKNQIEGKAKNQTRILSRYKLFFSQPKKLFQNPIYGLGMLFMKTCEFGFGGIGYLITKK